RAAAAGFSSQATADQAVERGNSKDGDAGDAHDPRDFTSGTDAHQPDERIGRHDLGKAETDAEPSRARRQPAGAGVSMGGGVTSIVAGRGATPRTPVVGGLVICCYHGDPRS